MRLEEIARKLSGRLLGEGQDIQGINSLRVAQPSELAFLLWPGDVLRAKSSQAGALIAPVGVVADHMDVLNAPTIAVLDIGAALHDLKGLVDKGHISSSGSPVLNERFISPSANVYETASIGKSRVGAGTRVCTHAVIEDDVVIGDSCFIGSGVIVHSRSRIGDGSVIGANSVVGSEAFVPFGMMAHNLPSLGHVVIKDHVTIGALCTIDRGLFGATEIGDDTLMDNMIHVGHDVCIGRNVIIAAQSGLAGFARLGDGVTLGGQVGIAPHVAVGENTRVSGKSSLHRDVGPNEVWSGNPALPHHHFLRAHGNLVRNFKRNK